MTEIAASKIKNNYLIILLLVLITLAVSTFATIYFYPKSDFFSQYVGARMLLEGKTSQLYSIESQKREFAQQGFKQHFFILVPFRNLPTTAMLYIPFAIIKPQMGYFLWSVCSIALYFYGIWIISKTTDNFDLRWYFLLFIWFAFERNFIFAQTGAIIFVIMALIYKHRQNALLCGSVSALLLLKANYLLAIPLIMALCIKDSETIEPNEIVPPKLRKILEFLLTFSISLGLLMLVNIALYGSPTIFRDLIYFTRSTENPAFGAVQEGQISLGAFLKYNFNLSFEQILILNSLLYILVFAIFYKRLSTLSKEFYFASILIITPFFAINSYPGDAVFVLIPILVFLSLDKFKQPTLYNQRIFYLATLMGLPLIPEILGGLNYRIGPYLTPFYFVYFGICLWVFYKVLQVEKVIESSIKE